jgi:hypothetical protein
MALNELTREHGSLRGSSSWAWQDGFPELGASSSERSAESQFDKRVRRNVDVPPPTCSLRCPTVEHCRRAAELRRLFARNATLLYQADNFYQTFQREILALD